MSLNHDLLEDCASSCLPINVDSRKDRFSVLVEMGFPPYAVRNVLMNLDEGTSMETIIMLLADASSREPGNKVELLVSFGYSCDMAEEAVEVCGTEGVDTGVYIQFLDDYYEKRG